MKTKIIIDNVAFSIQQIGGISVVWYEIIKRLLKDERFDVRFVEFSDARNNYYRKLLEIPQDKVRVVGSRYAMKWKRYINPYLGINEPHIFHSSYYRTARDRNALNFTTVHDFNYELSSNKDFRTWVHVWQQKQAVMNSDCVICISENTKKDLLSFYPKANERKIHVVYNGVSDDYRVIEGLDDHKLPFKKGTYCIFVGGRPAYKNFNLAVDSVAATGYNLVVVGPQLSEEETLMLNEKIGERRYVSMSRVSNEVLNELYNGAFCLLYPSSCEGFGIPSIEAQKSGCPVIAYDSTSIPEVMSDKESMIKELTVEAVLDKIVRLENERLRSEIVNEGVKFACKFSWDNTYRQLTELYLSQWG